MAQAPPPGASKAAENAPAVPTTFRMTLKGRTLELVNNLTIKEKMAVRIATGLPFDAFLAGENKIGEDSFMVLWWLARRQNGEPNLSFDAAAEEWPTTLSPDEIDLTMVEVEEGEESPEASGPGS